MSEPASRDSHVPSNAELAARIERQAEENREQWSALRAIGENVAEMRGTLQRLHEETQEHRRESREDMHGLQHRLDSIEKQPPRQQQQVEDLQRRVEHLEAEPPKSSGQGDRIGRVDRWSGALDLAQWQIRTIIGLLGLLGGLALFWDYAKAAVV